MGNSYEKITFFSILHIYNIGQLQVFYLEIKTEKQVQQLFCVQEKLSDDNWCNLCSPLTHFQIFDPSQAGQLAHRYKFGLKCDKKIFFVKQNSAKMPFVLLFTKLQIHDLATLMPGRSSPRVSRYGFVNNKQMAFYKFCFTTIIVFNFKTSGIWIQCWFDGLCLWSNRSLIET